MEPLTLAATAVAFLSPYLVKAGEKAVEEVGKKLPTAVGQMWQAIMARFKDKPAAAEAVKDVVAKPQDEDNQAALRKELRKVLETEPTFVAELERLLAAAQREAGDTITNTGSGAVATHGGVAAGAGGVAVRGDVHGGITLGGTEKKG
jgi:hypothetical protein